MGLTAEVKPQKTDKDAILDCVEQLKAEYPEGIPDDYIDILKEWADEYEVDLAELGLKILPPPTPTPTPTPIPTPTPTPELEYRPYTEEMRAYIIPPSDGYDAYLEREYIEIRKQGFDDISTVAKNTGISEEDLCKVKKHVFLDTHMLSVEGEPLKELYFQADSEIAYAWKLAQNGELSPEGKAWFEQMVKHELEESRIMEEEKLPLRDPSSYNSNGKAEEEYVNNAHDKANLTAPQPSMAFPGHDYLSEFNKYYSKNSDDY